MDHQTLRSRRLVRNLAILKEAGEQRQPRQFFDAQTTLLFKKFYKQLLDIDNSLKNDTNDALSSTIHTVLAAALADADAQTFNDDRIPILNKKIDQSGKSKDVSAAFPSLVAVMQKINSLLGSLKSLFVADSYKIGIQRQLTNNASLQDIIDVSFGANAKMPEDEKNTTIESIVDDISTQLKQLDVKVDASPDEILRISPTSVIKLQKTFDQLDKESQVLTGKIDKQVQQAKSDRKHQEAQQRAAVSPDKQKKLSRKAVDDLKGKPPEEAGEVIKAYAGGNMQQVATVKPEKHKR
jgi:hypothetical protein